MRSMKVGAALLIVMLMVASTRTRAVQQSTFRSQSQTVAVYATVTNAQGRLVTPKFGDKVHVAEIVWTDLPLAPDGEL